MRRAHRRESRRGLRLQLRGRYGLVLRRHHEITDRAATGRRLQTRRALRRRITQSGVVRRRGVGYPELGRAAAIALANVGGWPVDRYIGFSRRVNTGYDSP